MAQSKNIPKPPKFPTTKRIKTSQKPLSEEDEAQESLPKEDEVQKSPEEKP